MTVAEKAVVVAHFEIDRMLGLAGIRRRFWRMPSVFDLDEMIVIFLDLRRVQNRSEQWGAGIVLTTWSRRKGRQDA